MKNEHQLIVENWRRFVVEQTQPQQGQQQTPLQDITDASKAQITQPGANKETLANLLALVRNPRNLISIVSAGGTKLIDAYKQIKQMLTGDDFNEASKIALMIINAIKQVISSLNQTPTQASQVNELKRIKRRPRPTSETTQRAFNLTVKILEALGNGSVEAGLAKFGGASATIALCGIILGLIASAVQTANPAIVGEIAQLIPLLAKTNTLGNAKDLAGIIEASSKIAPAAQQVMTESTEYDDAHLDDGTLVCAGCLQELLESQRTIIQEAKYQGRTVTLNKPMKGDVKKSKVYVKDPKTGNVKKVNFGDKNMKIKKSNPKRRKSFRARHNCENPGPKTKARFWSCKAW